MCVLTVPPSGKCPVSRLLRPSNPWDTILKLDQLVTLQRPFKCSSEKGKSHVSLSQKLEMIKLSEESMWKAEIG